MHLCGLICINFLLFFCRQRQLCYVNYPPGLKAPSDQHSGVIISDIGVILPRPVILTSLTEIY